MSFNLKPKKAYWLLNQTPFDGCLLVFNALQHDWRIKASDFKRREGIAFKVHAITGAKRGQAHSRTPDADLYVTLEGLK